MLKDLNFAIFDGFVDEFFKRYKKVAIVFLNGEQTQKMYISLGAQPEI